jgi:hypothetical protein
MLILTLPLLCGSFLLAQTKKSEPTTLTASVFLITQGGDLKPARLGKVVAFYLRRQDAKEETIGQIFADEIEAAHAIHKNLGPTTLFTEREMCLKEVEELVQDTQRTAKAMDDPAFASQLLTITLDEEGKGSVKVSRPGMYVVAAFGNAGINSGFWFESARIEAGKETRLKLSSPLVGCVRDE